MVRVLPPGCHQDVAPALTASRQVCPAEECAPLLTTAAINSPTVRSRARCALRALARGSHPDAVPASLAIRLAGLAAECALPKDTTRTITAAAPAKRRAMVVPRVSVRTSRLGAATALLASPRVSLGEECARLVATTTTTAAVAGMVMGAAATTEAVAMTTAAPTMEVMEVTTTAAMVVVAMVVVMVAAEAMATREGNGWMEEG